MCSVIGFSGEYNEDLLSKLFFNSRVRGLHAFGFSFVLRGELVTKKYLNYNKFIEGINADKPSKFIAHFRYSTSGDYLNADNNQPILSKQSALVFNGVLDMRTKTGMEKAYNIQMDTENDGEIAMSKMLDGKNSLIEYLSKTGTFAGLFLNKKNEISSIRNNRRPLYRAEHNGSVYFASTKDIMTRSGISNANMITPNLIHND